MGILVRLVLAVLVAVAAVLPALASDSVLPGLDALKWTNIPVAIFADGPGDPRVARQLALLADRQEELDAHGVVVVVDTDPAANSEWRQRLRPRDFTFVLIDLEGRVAYRKPAPVPAREIIRLIDRMDVRP